METIAVANWKGGTGKTTTTVCLAAALAERGRRVLVIDMDPQASASRWLGADDDLMTAVLVDRAPIAEAIRSTPAPNLSVVPTTGDLSGAELALFGKKGGAELVLQRALRQLPADAFDYVLIDCGPSLGFLTLNALMAASGVIIPVEAHHMALEGVAKMLASIEEIAADTDHPLALRGVAVCRYDSRSIHVREIIDQLRGALGDRVFATMIRTNIRLAEAPSFAQPITLYAPDSNGAADYRALAAEVDGVSAEAIPATPTTESETHI